MNFSLLLVFSFGLHKSLMDATSKQSNIIMNFRDAALRLCRGSFMHAAAVVRGGQFVSLGYCASDRTYIGGNLYSSCHAEVLAIRRWLLSSQGVLPRRWEKQCSFEQKGNGILASM